MRFFKFFVIAIVVVVASCTVNKTDYEAEISTTVTEYYEFKEAVLFTSGTYKISVEALNGTFYKGYNKVRLKMVNTQTNKHITNSEVTFLPIMTDFEGKKNSCPHKYNLVYDAKEGGYIGYAVFLNETNAVGSWDLYLSFSENNQITAINQAITVKEQTNKNLNVTTFTAADNEKYCIALVSPQKPKVAENDLVAGIYKYNQPTTPAGIFPDPSQFSYDEVQNYILEVDPRMPEPSMGNHSSLHNKNLTQKSNGLYYGIANYTMTGNWTLNFVLRNQYNQVIKGTTISTEFTPGTEGAKSELYIDIVF